MIVSTGRLAHDADLIATQQIIIIHVGFVQAECYKNCLEVT